MKTKILAVLALAACFVVPASTEGKGDLVAIRFEFVTGSFYTAHPRVPGAVCVVSETPEGLVGQCSATPARVTLGAPV